MSRAQKPASASAAFGHCRRNDRDYWERRPPPLIADQRLSKLPAGNMGAAPDNKPAVFAGCAASAVLAVGSVALAGLGRIALATAACAERITDGGFCAAAGRVGVIVPVVSFAAAAARLVLGVEILESKLLRVGWRAGVLGAGRSVVVATRTGAGGGAGCAVATMFAIDGWTPSWGARGGTTWSGMVPGVFPMARV